MTTATAREWIFTFGVGHTYARRFVRIRGEEEQARAQMIRCFGNAWAFQYSTEEEAGVGRYGLTELVIE